jgi:hypothetical protein
MQENEIDIIENVIFFRINKLYKKNMTSTALYETTRGVWRIGKRRERADYAFSVYKNEVLEVYKIWEWFPAGTLEYQTRSKDSTVIRGRWEFKGQLAAQELRKKYIGMSLEKIIKPRSRNPIIYYNCKN